MRLLLSNSFFALLFIIIPFNAITPQSNPLLGSWDYLNGPTQARKYVFITTDSVCITIELPETTYVVCPRYLNDINSIPHRLTFFSSGGAKGNLCIYEIYGDTLKIECSGGDTINFPPSFEDPSFFLRNTVGVNNDYQITPQVFKLMRNYPNPFNPSTRIKFQLPNREFVTVKVFDVLGNEVATLVNEEKAFGTYEVEFEGTDLPSGVYFYQLKAGDFVETKKMVLMR